jgi:hypothetical protein
MKTIADMIPWIETENPFTPAFQKKVLGSVRKMKKLPQYGCPVDQIPADLDAFEKLWGRGAVRNIPHGFKSKSQFADWRSQVRSALTAYFDVPKDTPAPTQNDGWSQVYADLEAVGVPKQKLIAVTVLAQAARKASLEPIDVSRDWLQEAADRAVTPGQYDAFKSARALIDKSKSALSVPVSPAFSLPMRKSTTHCVRLDLTPRFAGEVANWQKKFTQGQRKGHRAKRKSVRSPQRAEDVLRGVTYIYTAMVTAGHINPHDDPSINKDPDDNASDPTMLNLDVLDDIIERELEGKFPWRQLKVTTLFEYLMHWKLFVRGCGHSAEELSEVISDFTEFENVKSMSTARRDWCENFMLNHNKQAAFFKLPNSLFDQAKKAMLGYENGSQGEKDIAIGLGIAACAAAIWTSLPLRISTLLRLTYGGENADIQLHANRHGLMITTPPDIVKNGYSHRQISLPAKAGGDPRKIVSWFVTDVRPIFLDKHIAPHLRNPKCLFGGLSCQRLGSIWRTITLEAGVPMTPHQVRHALATVMANQPKADYAIIAALLGDTEATVRKNYALVDQAKKGQEGQRLLSEIQGHILMRGVA